MGIKESLRNVALAGLVATPGLLAADKAAAQENSDGVYVYNQPATSSQEAVYVYDEPVTTYTEPQDVFVYDKKEEQEISRVGTLLNTADDLTAAYAYCNNGSTYQNPNLGVCLEQFLRDRGYNEQQLHAFEARRLRSFNAYRECSECLGWMGALSALWSGTDNPDTTLNTFGHAGNINQYFGNGTPLPVGTELFYSQGYAEGTKVKPGDILISNMHIALVKDILPQGNVLLYESNGYMDCRVTEDRVVNKAGYVVYRMS